MTDTEPNQESVSLAMRRALKLCLDGAPDEGLAQFRAAFKKYQKPETPVALFVRMLQEAGRLDTADRLRSLALHAGADLNVSRSLPSATDEARLVEYRALFDAKIINSAMIANYLVLLSRMGNVDEIPRHFGEDVIRNYFLAEANDVADPVNPDLIRDEVLAQTKQQSWSETNQSVRNAHVISLARAGDDPDRRLLADMPETRRLIEAAEAIGDAFKASPRKSNLPFWAMEPDAMAVAAWAIVSEGAGYNVPHVHGRAWMTGVFYAAAPDWALTESDDQGNLRIGRPAKIAEDAPGWPDLSFTPIPGRFVLMPAYAVHWTVPLHRPGLRISIAMDFMPRD